MYSHFIFRTPIVLPYSRCTPVLPLYSRTPICTPWTPGVREYAFSPLVFVFSTLSLTSKAKLNMSSVCVDLSTFALTEQYMINVYLMCMCLRAFILIEQDMINVYLLRIRLSIFILTEQDRMNVSSVCVGLPPPHAQRARQVKCVSVLYSSFRRH
jgi:hypothetical protein